MKMADPELAAMMQRLKPKAPMEKVVYVDYLATALSFTARKISIDHRVVKLECGHTAITKASRRCACKECLTMIMNGEDYDAFRNRR